MLLKIKTTLWGGIGIASLATENNCRVMAKGLDAKRHRAFFYSAAAPGVAGAGAAGVAAASAGAAGFTLNEAGAERGVSVVN